MSAVQELPAILKNRRKQLGLTLAQVARRAGTSPESLSRYENGWRRFEITTLRKLASSLGCILDVKLVPLERPAEPAFGTGLSRLSRLFWDHSLVARDLRELSRWVVARVVEYGDLRDLRFTASQLGTERFLQLTGEVRFSSRKAAHFWRSIRTMEGTTCVKRPSRPAAGEYWRR